MKTKTALLAIFLTFTNLTLSADVAAAPDNLPETKYVSEQNPSNSPKKDRTKFYNFLLALAAVAVATTAIILVSENKGKSTN